MSKEQTTRSLLDSVSKDVSHLRRDISSLFSHTSRRAIPEGARELAEYGKDRLHAGGEFAASHLRNLRAHPGQTSIGLAGGLILLGAVGVGIYYLCKSGCEKQCSIEDESDSDYSSPKSNSPSYIS